METSIPFNVSSIDNVSECIFPTFVLKGSRDESFLGCTPCKSRVN